MWMILTKGDTVIVSPKLELLARLAIKLGCKLGPMKLELKLEIGTLDEPIEPF